MHRPVNRFLLVATTTSCILSLLGLPPECIQQIAAATIAILAVWDSFGDYARKTPVLHVIGLRGCCRRFDSKLIDPTYLMVAALDKCEVLRQRPIETTKHTGLVGFSFMLVPTGNAYPCDAKTILHMRVNNDYGRHVCWAHYS